MFGSSLDCKPGCSERKSVSLGNVPTADKRWKKQPYMLRMPVPQPTSSTTLSLKMWRFW
jgi:hypothetical protein